MITLTPAELHQLTGYRTATHQARYLAAAGVPYRRNKCGQIIVSRAVAEAWLGGTTPTLTEPAVAPYFEALRLLSVR